MGSSMIYYFNKSYLEGEWTKVGPKLKLVKKQQSLISQERRVLGVLRFGQCSRFVCVEISLQSDICDTLHYIIVMITIIITRVVIFLS